MKVGDLVGWKATPGSIAVVIDKRADKDQEVYDLLWSDVPPKLAGIAKCGVVKGFAPWELEVINDS